VSRPACCPTLVKASPLSNVGSGNVGSGVSNVGSGVPRDPEEYARTRIHFLVETGVTQRRSAGAALPCVSHGSNYFIPFFVQVRQLPLSFSEAVASATCVSHLSQFDLTRQTCMCLMEQFCSNQCCTMNFPARPHAWAHTQPLTNASTQICAPRRRYLPHQPPQSGPCLPAPPQCTKALAAVFAGHPWLVRYMASAAFAGHP